MKLHSIITDLNRAGLNDAAIARALQEEEGLTTTQATINRIKHGVYKSTRFDIGMALISLHKKRCRRRAD